MLDVDYALVGGGLQNGLIALALAAQRPEARVVMIERGSSIGGNHTWCFHAADLPAGGAAWIDPIVVARWPGYDVEFLTFSRALATAYACVSTQRLAERVTAVLGAGVRLRTVAEHIDDAQVIVRDASGVRETIRARVVIDARGPDRVHPAACGWQKFVGHELAFAAPHGLERPLLMDATVRQHDGFRFMYVLPLAYDRLLVEDTCFSDGSHLDVAASRAAIASYVATRGWRGGEVVREETGVLPMPWLLAAPTPRAPLVAGYAGGWFHPVTGYSFPIAARLASLVASLAPDALFGSELADFAAAHARQLSFALRLTHMLFRWFPPDQRHHVLARFYRLPERAIARFYSLQLTSFDRARMLVGAPPRGMSWRAAFGLEAR